MTLDTVIMLTGAFVLVLPFLGFPNSWDTVFFFFAGLLTIGLGIIVRYRTQDEVQSDTYRESFRPADAIHEEA